MTAAGADRLAARASGRAAAHPDADERFFAELRAREFSRLDALGETYLDYTGSALHPESLVARHLTRLNGTVLGNPHSASPASRRSTEAVERARQAVLRLLDADPAEYDVCFAANASNAIRLVAEAFPWRADSQLALSSDNHNSVNGVREYARCAGATVRALPLDEELRLDDPSSRLGRAPRGPSLLAYPAQSNFSGVRHPLSLVHTAREAGWHVLLDAAAFLPTARLSLREHPADFVALSVYKIAGYPGGVGALVARRGALAMLRRPWFAGGTVEFASVQGAMHRLREGAEAFEDGTPSFLALDAVPDALAFVDRVGIGAVGAHVRRLTALLLDGLAALRHRDGRALVTLYGPRGTAQRGGTIALNVIDAGGRVVPYAVIEEEARAANISLRGGCFCNPGAAEHAFGFPAKETRRCLKRSPRPFDPARLADCLGGKSVGAVRLSLGMASDRADVERAVQLLARWVDRRGA